MTEISKYWYKTASQVFLSLKKLGRQRKEVLFPISWFVSVNIFFHALLGNLSHGLQIFLLSELIPNLSVLICLPTFHLPPDIISIQIIYLQCKLHVSKTEFIILSQICPWLEDRRRRQHNTGQWEIGDHSIQTQGDRDRDLREEDKDSVKVSEVL